MRKVIVFTIVAYLFTLVLYYNFGYKRTSDRDYQIDIPEPKPYVDTVNYQKFFLPRDKSKYKGKWVDLN